MAPMLDPETEKQMRENSRAIKEKMASGSFTPSWNLSGKNAIVESGSSVIVRLCPRWDYAQSMVRQGDKFVPNPAYKGGPMFVKIGEHWWDGPGGKTQHEWCPGEGCPICTAAAVMIASKDDRKYGKRIQAKRVFIFNAVIGRPRRLTKEGRADIRILAVPDSVFDAISDISTGGAEKSFARGDVAHPRAGYDLKLTRPIADSGDRWKVDCAPGESQLYEADQAAAFKGWPSLLIDLEDMLEKEVKSPEDVFKAFYGRDPNPDEMAGAGSASGNGASPTQDGDDGFGVPAAIPAGAPVAPDEFSEFMPPPPEAPRAPTQAPAGQPMTRPAPRGRR